MDTITVIVADDHKIVREGIISLLMKEQDIEVVGEASNGHEVLKLTRKLVPDVVVMDLQMPKLNGIEATRQIKKYSPLTEILVLSMSDSEQYVHNAFKAGASGYVIKGEGSAELTTAIRAVYDGQAYLSPDISRAVISVYAEGSNKDEEMVLTSRQVEIVQLIAEGYTNKEIAKELYITEKTVSNHRLAIMKKLDIHDVASITKWAITQGIISVDQNVRKKPPMRT